MTVSYRKSFAFLATAALLAGCSTAPTLTVPNPLAALNSALSMPRVATAPSGYINTPTANVYQPAPASYSTVAPSYTSAAPTVTYGAAAPTYTTSAPTYATSAPVYTTSAPSYATSVPVQASAPSYTMSTPVAQTNSYSLGNTVVAAPSYTTGTTMIESTAMPMQSYASSVPTLGAVQPVQASGTTYDLTAPALTPSFDPAAGLSVDTGYGTLAAPVAAPSMGGSFQVLPQAAQSVGNGIATYNAAQSALDLPSISY